MNGETPLGAHVPMAGGAEFDAIRALVAQWGDLAVGIGDDAAVFTPPAGELLVFSTDSSLEDVHFRAGWLAPDEIGARATAAALSDLAAMGARARVVLVSLQVPSAWRGRLSALADGIGRVVRAADARIVGGNITAGERLGLTLTVVGSTARPVLRRGARVGDGLWVTGVLGGPRRALLAWEAGGAPGSADRARFAAPMPRLAEGRWLAQAGAQAMIDISDGLSADAGHLAAASGVRCELWTESVPVVAGGSAREAMASGEEYELLVAMPADFDASEFLRTFALPLTQVGVVRAVTAVAENSAPARVDLPAGHDHFSS